MKMNANAARARVITRGILSGQNPPVASPRPALLIFDCDGVLVDSERLALRVGSTGLRELGWSMLDGEFVERFVGRSDADIRALLVDRFGAETTERWLAEFERRYDAALSSELRAVDGIEAALARIDVPVCVASSSRHGHVRRVLTQTGLYDRFAGRIFSAVDVPHGKPAPDLFLHAAATLGADPPACVVIEDSSLGVEAARAAGMRALGYAGGVTPAARLEAAGAIVFDDMRRLPELITAGEAAR